MAEARLDPAGIDGYATRVEYTHLAVATAVASGAADVGLGIEAAASAHGLAFVPLVEEDYYLVCLKPMLDSPLVARCARCSVRRPGRRRCGLAGLRTAATGRGPVADAGLALVAFARPKRR